MRSRSPLRTSLSRRRLVLARHLPAALTGDSHAVHQARVASRRLREALPIAGADFDGTGTGGRTAAKTGVKAGSKALKKARRRMRRLTRALGPVRELEVALTMVLPPQDSERAIAADDPTRRGRDHVAAAIQRQLDRAHERLAGEFDGDTIERWLDALQDLERTIEEADAGGGAAMSAGDGKAARGRASRVPVQTRRGRPKWRARLAARLVTRAAHLREAMDEAGVLFVSERLHEVRIALKRLRYALELAGELRVASTSAAVRELKKVQDVLGSLHDHDVLMAYTEKASETPFVNRPTRASLIALHRALDLERHELHAQFLAKRPLLVKLHDRALQIAARARTITTVATSPHA